MRITEKEYLLSLRVVEKYLVQTTIETSNVISIHQNSKKEMLSGSISEAVSYLSVRSYNIFVYTTNNQDEPVSIHDDPLSSVMPLNLPKIALARNVGIKVLLELKEWCIKYGFDYIDIPDYLIQPKTEKVEDKPAAISHPTNPKVTLKRIPLLNVSIGNFIRVEDTRKGLVKSLTLGELYVVMGIKNELSGWADEPSGNVFFALIDNNGNTKEYKSTGHKFFGAYKVIL